MGGLRRGGGGEISVDLIAGLPGQTRARWAESLVAAIGTGVPHVSVYLLEVDEDSRLGRERMEGGGRYGAGELPTDDDAAEMYEMACDRLEAAGVRQYEISNFARAGHGSRHNLKYWERKPYVGFGLDAHSMLRGLGGGVVRFANGDDLGGYLSAGTGLEMVGAGRTIERVEGTAAFEECLFLGLRKTAGVDLGAVREEFGRELVDGATAAMRERVAAGWMERDGEWVRLTRAGRMVSNEVFSRLLVDVAVAV